VRATKDLDLTYHGFQADMVLALEEALAAPYGRFRFQRTGAVFEMDRAESLRVEIGVRFDGAEWGTLPLDLTRSESPAETIELVAALDLLGTFGIEGPTVLPCLSLAYHLAHKLHAATRPDSQEYPNERVQDLIDLLIFRDELTSPTHRILVRAACVEVFGGRSTHPWPPEFVPPERWTEPFARMANELTLEPTDLHEALGPDQLRQLLLCEPSGRPQLVNLPRHGGLAPLFSQQRLHCRIVTGPRFQHAKRVGVARSLLGVSSSRAALVTVRISTAAGRRRCERRIPRDPPRSPEAAVRVHGRCPSASRILCTCSRIEANGIHSR